MSLQNKDLGTTIFIYYFPLALAMVTIRLQVKELINQSGIDNIAADFHDKLDEKVKQMVLDAAKRAKDNGRRTIMGRDV